jgi:hypothetical protein
MRTFRLISLMLAVLMAACVPRPAPEDGDGVRLLADVTLAPTTALPTVTSSYTPDPSITATAVPPTSTQSNERVSSLQVVTQEADVVIVTPTLPPSKTPSITPTSTTSPTVSPTPTITVTATATTFQYPTVVFTPIPAVVIQPVDELCLTNWTFIQPPPQGCPLAPATVGNGVYQTFERGHMIWVGAWDVIYVMFADGSTPYWRRYQDTFDEAIHPWDAPELDNSPSRPPNTWQPRRGFGKLWREAPPEEILNRVGWGTIEKEVPYSVKVQTRADGTVFVNDSSGRVFMLTPGGMWTIYAGFAN